MTPAQLHRGRNWTPDEDRKLLDLIEAGKSSVLIAAILKEIPAVDQRQGARAETTIP